MEQQNRRGHVRVSVWLQAKFDMLIPEDTFSAQQMDCTVCDISERGALIMTSIPDEFYSKLLQRVRHCRVYFSESTNLPRRITGKAVWIQPERSGKATNIKIGLFFEDCSEEALQQLRTFVVKHLASQQQR